MRLYEHEDTVFNDVSFFHEEFVQTWEQKIKEYNEKEGSELVEITEFGEDNNGECFTVMSLTEQDYKNVSNDVVKHYTDKIHAQFS